MFDEEDRETGYALFLAIGLAILVSLFAIAVAAGTAIGQLGAASKRAGTGLPVSGSPSASSAPAPVSASASAASTVAVQPAPAAAVAARLYFDLGKAALPADAAATLAPLMAAATGRSGVTWLVSGYHDASGDAAANAELAKQRAFAVRDLLVASGVPAGAIELAKPALTMGGADAREARRVEVTLR